MNVGESLDKEERPAYVQFETRAVENKQETLKQGHYVGRDVDFVLVTLPGGRDIYESKVDPWFDNKERQARNGRVDPAHLDYYHRAYKAWKEGQEIPVDGTPVKGWGLVSPMQEKTILMAGIKTIEDLAASNDEALRRLGMGGRDLVNKAKSWLSSVSDHGKVAMENAALKKENENLRTTVESLEEKVNFLMHKMDQKEDVPYKDDEDEWREMDVPRETITADDILPDVTEVPQKIESQPEYSRGELNQMYRDKFNRKANVRMTDESIKQKLGL